MATMTEPTSLSSPTRQPGRRAVTVPTRLQTPNEQADMDAKGAETLFAHQAAKVVSFSASKLGGPGTSKTSRPEAGTLPWTSRGELLISLGMWNVTQDGHVYLTHTHQAPSVSTVSAAPSPSSMLAHCSSPSSPAPNAGASTANPNSPCAFNISSTASSSPTQPQRNAHRSKI